MFKANVKDNFQGQGLAGQGQLATRILEAKAMSSRTPSRVSVQFWPNRHIFKHNYWTHAAQRHLAVIPVQTAAVGLSLVPSLYRQTPLLHNTQVHMLSTKPQQKLPTFQWIWAWVSSFLRIYNRSWLIVSDKFDRQKWCVKWRINGIIDLKYLINFKVKNDFKTQCSVFDNAD